MRRCLRVFLAELEIKATMVLVKQVVMRFSVTSTVPVGLMRQVRIL